ncbi:MAG: hypothetical protein AAF602_13075 [Myxococcota bacterium]
MPRLALLALAACNLFSDTAVTIEGHTLRTFDDRLPDAMEQVFADCMEPIVIAHNDTVAGPWTCSAYPAGSPEAAVADLLALDSASVPMTLFTPPITLFVRSCTITYSPRYELHAVALYDLDASWRSHTNGPGLRIDFDFEEGWGVDVFPGATATCANWWDQWVVDSQMATLNAGVTAFFTDPDLDIRVGLNATTGRSDIAVDVGVGELDPTGYFDAVSYLDVLGGTRLLNPLVIENRFGAALEAALAGANADVTSALGGLGELCSAQVVGGELELVHDEDCEIDWFLPRW